MVNDMDALMAAADELHDASQHYMQFVQDHAWDESPVPPYSEPGTRLARAHIAYRAAREAVTRGTPPAFATSA